jgi:hypothetical protein
MQEEYFYLICPCCLEKLEMDLVYFGNGMEAIRCSKCLIAYPK